MRFYRNLNDISFSNVPSVVTIGMFDGVHLGHLAVLNKVLEISRKNNIPSIVLTFSNHPARFFDSSLKDEQLTTWEEKKNLIQALGIDILIVVPFDEFLAGLSAQEFVNTIILKKLNAKHIVFGYDNHFGQNREGSKDFIDLNFPHILSYRVPETIINHEIISSSIIKQCLVHGDVDKAKRLLNYPYTLKGIIIQGDQLGRKIGFPTANMKVPTNKILPKRGVYLTRCSLDSQFVYGMTNIGIRPTVTDKEELRIETNLFDFDKEIYGHPLQIEFISRMRDEMKFDSLKALMEQLQMDKNNAIQQLT